jgi:hypothetical protein
VRQAVAAGMADFRAQFELHRQAEAEKQKTAQAFQRFKAEQEQARAQQAKADALTQARQAESKKAAEPQRNVDIERAPPSRGGPGWSR